jgi:hypothetical protein
MKFKLCLALALSLIVNSAIASQDDLRGEPLHNNVQVHPNEPLGPLPQLAPAAAVAPEAPVTLWQWFGGALGRLSDIADELFPAGNGGVRLEDVF